MTSFAIILLSLGGLLFYLFFNEDRVKISLSTPQLSRMSISLSQRNLLGSLSGPRQSLLSLISMPREFLSSSPLPAPNPPCFVCSIHFVHGGQGIWSALTVNLWIILNNCCPLNKLNPVLIIPASFPVFKIKHENAETWAQKGLSNIKDATEWTYFNII